MMRGSPNCQWRISGDIGVINNKQKLIQKLYLLLVECLIDLQVRTVQFNICLHGSEWSSMILPKHLLPSFVHHHINDRSGATFEVLQFCHRNTTAIDVTYFPVQLQKILTDWHCYRLHYRCPNHWFVDGCAVCKDRFV